MVKVNKVFLGVSVEEIGRYVIDVFVLNVFDVKFIVKVIVYRDIFILE